MCVCVCVCVYVRVCVCNILLFKSHLHTYIMKPYIGIIRQTINSTHQKISFKYIDRKIYYDVLVMDDEQMT